MRTFHEEKNSRSAKPIRLSYHGNEHYNSIIEIPSQSKEEVKNQLSKQKPQIVGS